MSYTILQTCRTQPIAISDASVETTHSKTTTSSPSVFGPAYWSYYHISTVHLPEALNPAIANQIRNVLFAIPVTVPCDVCSLHSGNFISQNKDRLMSLKSGSDFFNFTVDLHNLVNKRLGRHITSYEEAREVWK